MGKAGTLLCFATLYAVACSAPPPGVQVVRYPEAAGVPARDTDCDVEVLDWYAVPEGDCRDLGDVFVPSACRDAQIRSALRREACRIGANLALTRPVVDDLSSCPATRARLLLCQANSGASQTTP